MGMERRGCIDRLYLMVNQQWEEPLSKVRSDYFLLINRSRMNREVHVWICEGVG